MGRFHRPKKDYNYVDFQAQRNAMVMVYGRKIIVM